MGRGGVGEGVPGVHSSMFGALWALAPFISCIAEGAVTTKAVSECLNLP